MYLSTPGTYSYSLPYTWDGTTYQTEDMKVVAWVQDMGASISSPNVYGATWVWWPMNYRFYYHRGVRTQELFAPGTANLAGDYLKNGGTSTDTYALSVGGVMSAGWSATLSAGSLSDVDSGQITLAPGESTTVDVNITSSGDGAAYVDLIIRSLGSAKAETLSYGAYQNATALVVDDDQGADYEQYYLQSLFDIGEAPELFDRSKGSITGAYMLGYDFVVWLTGTDWTDIFYTNDTTAIGDFMDGGGKLFISSQDLGYFADYYSISSWYQNRFKASYVADDAGISSVAGVTGGPFDGLSYNIYSGDAADFGGDVFPSEINAYGGGELAMQYSGGSSPGAAVVYDGGSDRLVYFAFAVGVVDGLS